MKINLISLGMTEIIDKGIKRLYTHYDKFLAVVDSSQYPIKVFKLDRLSIGEKSKITRWLDYNFGRDNVQNNPEQFDVIVLNSFELNKLDE